MISEYSDCTKIKGCRFHIENDACMIECRDYTSLIPSYRDHFAHTKNPAAIHQPDPEPGRQVVLDQVMQDLKDRADVGEKKYGTKLMTNNGRDALMDAYQEALDLAMYIRQAIMERDGGEHG